MTNVIFPLYLEFLSSLRKSFTPSIMRSTLTQLLAEKAAKKRSSKGPKKNALTDTPKVKDKSSNSPAKSVQRLKDFQQSHWIESEEDIPTKVNNFSSYKNKIFSSESDSE